DEAAALLLRVVHAAVLVVAVVAHHDGQFVVSGGTQAGRDGERRRTGRRRRGQVGGEHVLAEVHTVQPRLQHPRAAPAVPQAQRGGVRGVAVVPAVPHVALVEAVVVGRQYGLAGGRLGGAVGTGLVGRRPGGVVERGRRLGRLRSGAPRGAGQVRQRDRRGPGQLRVGALAAGRRAGGRHRVPVPGDPVCLH